MEGLFGRILERLPRRSSNFTTHNKGLVGKENMKRLILQEQEHIDQEMDSFLRRGEEVPEYLIEAKRHNEGVLRGF